MTKLKLSEFLKLPIKPFIYGAFLSRIMSKTANGQKYFYTYSDFRSSKYVHKDDFPLDQYSNEFINTSLFLANFSFGTLIFSSKYLKYCF